MTHDDSTLPDPIQFISHQKKVRALHVRKFTKTESPLNEMTCKTELQKKIIYWPVVIIGHQPKECPSLFRVNPSKLPYILHQVWMSPKWLPFQKIPLYFQQKLEKGPNFKQLPRMGYLSSLASLENIRKYHSFKATVVILMVVSASLNWWDRWYIIIQLAICKVAGFRGKVDGNLEFQLWCSHEPSRKYVCWATMKQL